MRPHRGLQNRCEAAARVLFTAGMAAVAYSGAAEMTSEEGFNGRSVCKLMGATIMAAAVLLAPVCRYPEIPASDRLKKA